MYVPLQAAALRGGVGACGGQDGEAILFQEWTFTTKDKADELNIHETNPRKANLLYYKTIKNDY